MADETHPLLRLLPPRTLSRKKRKPAFPPRRTAPAHATGNVLRACMRFIFVRNHRQGNQGTRLRTSYSFLRMLVPRNWTKNEIAQISGGA